mmetsp:Transcript_49741/g.155651  ORF Transcript_49741/g.155651 Transcript_49741/m.155651 type:complete len:263 (-) Transcript_49741:357-1145(-)
MKKLKDVDGQLSSMRSAHAKLVKACGEAEKREEATKSFASQLTDAHRSLFFNFQAALSQLTQSLAERETQMTSQMMDQRQLEEKKLQEETKMRRDLQEEAAKLREEAQRLQAQLDVTSEELRRKEVQQKIEIDKLKIMSEHELTKKLELAISKRQADFDTKERNFRSTVNKLLSGEEALESSLTCMGCLRLMQAPVTCIPCGHSFCSTCIQGEDGALLGCFECGGDDPVRQVVRSDALDALCAKHAHRMHELVELQAALRRT